MTRAAPDRPPPAGRPEALFPLFAPVETLPGIGPRLAKLMAKLGLTTIADILFHLPIRIIDRRYRPKIGGAEIGRLATLRVIVERHQTPPSRRGPTRVIVRDETGFMSLVYFQVHGDYLTKTLPEGETRWVSGIVEEYHGARQIAHPDFVVTDEEFAEHPTVEPVYALTQGLTNRVAQKAAAGALAKLPHFDEWLDPHWLEQSAWPAFGDAIRAVHHPTEDRDIALSASSRRRLAYDELLASQLALHLMRGRIHGARGRQFIGDGRVTERILAALPFRLTGSQSAAFAEIRADLQAPQRMVRLLQGDVGSGKTVVALLALATVIEAGAQGAFMAPTEILARQHLETIAPLAEAAGIRIALLTGRDKGQARTKLLAELRDGGIDLLIGTHALLVSDVVFKSLGLVVVDEQHRFGVHQRLRLSEKSEVPTDLLVMTATPIPRTLTLALYGDMEVSRLTEKPPGRQPVKTVLIGHERMEEVTERLSNALLRGARAYWVCPLIAESEVADLAAAEERHAALALRFPGKTGLIHGRLRSAEKDAAMTAFQSGQIQLLVATTVIEVGVHVPEASIMVIEHAERFGLAQLHQLRGRIGRGQDASTCLLLYHAPLGETAAARLKILRETEDGFRIAEEDLRLRGPGELLGTRQSGAEEFRLASLEAHGDLLAAARDDAKLVLARDPALDSPRGRALRTLLYLFGRDEAVRLLKAG